MAFTTVISESPGGVIASADWNTYVRDNLNWIGSLSGLIMYYNGASAPSCFSEFTTARGLFICGLVSGGTLATAVGTPLTNQQNVTHTHTVSINGYSVAGAPQSGYILIDTGSGNPLGTNDMSGAPTTGSASAGSIGIPYIQLMAVTHQ